VNDILVDGAFDEAAQGMDYVLHIASPITRPVSRLPRKGGIAELWSTSLNGHFLMCKPRAMIISKTSSTLQYKGR
jgi:hypothetical protein